MLTDEEIQMIWNYCIRNRKTTIDFAKSIERAVLAKVMPIPKQEPVAVVAEWVGARSRRDRINLMVDVPIGHTFLKGEKLYAEPQPAQAAAIPEIVRERMNMLFDSINGDAYIGETEERHLVSQIKEWLSASPKQEHESKCCCEGGIHCGHSYDCKKLNEFQTKPE